jgi:hypothetical protein
MQLKKNPQLDALNKQAVSRTTKQLKTKPQLDALKKQAASSEKNIPPDKKSKSCVGTLVRITFTYLPVVMILAAIAQLSFTCVSATKPKLSEPKQYVGLMNRAQQAKYANDGAFYNSINAMTSGITTPKTNYNYSIIATKKAAFSYAVSMRETQNLTSYVGAVFLVPVSQAAKNEKTTVSILCAANSPENTRPPAPILQNGNPVCAAGSSVVTK